MHDNPAFGKGLAEDTKTALEPMVKAKKVEVVYFDAITPGEKDYKVSLTNLRESKPDVWYFTGYYAEAALLVTQARDIGIKCPFVGGNAAINDEFVKIAGVKVAKGCYMTNEPLPGDLPYKEAKDFLAAYKAKFGDIPSSPWPIYAADAVNIIAYAIDKSSPTDSDKIADFLRNKAKKSRHHRTIGFTAQVTAWRAVSTSMW
jgi:branched-chain amino acid transport system substrate-binding protein